MFSSKDLEWGTPQHFFHRLEDKFGTFTLDPCSNNSNYKVRNHFTEEDDGLSQDWGGLLMVVLSRIGSRRLTRKHRRIILLLLLLFLLELIRDTGTTML
jgi:hypothetical protein